MSLSSTDFIAENVEVLAKYVINDKQQWCTGVIANVFEHGVKDGHHYVECEVEYADEKVDETFWDFDYETNSEDAWRFSSNYKPLVDHVLALDAELNDNDDYEPTEGSETSDADTDAQEEHDSVYDDTDDTDDSATEYSDETDNEEELVYQKRPQSFFKRVLATLFTLSPSILTALVIYNAREDIAHVVRRKVCGF
jgi:hypothetical protein